MPFVDPLYRLYFPGQCSCADAHGSSAERIGSKVNGISNSVTNSGGLEAVIKCRSNRTATDTSVPFPVNQSACIRVLPFRMN